MEKREENKFEVEDCENRGLIKRNIYTEPSSSINDENCFKKFIRSAGPGFIVSIACLDPGNLSGDIAVAQETRMRLLWVLITAHVMAYLFQDISLTVGIQTNNDLANCIRRSYSKKTSLFLWLMAELAVICADTQEVIGSAVALKLIFGMPVSYGVAFTILASLAILHLQNYGQRLIEAIFALFVGVMGLCFSINYFIIGPSIKESVLGLVPLIKGSELPVALSLMGSIIMPQNLYLHSSLVLSRTIDNNEYETKIVMAVSLFINMTVIGTFSYFSNKSVFELENAYIALSEVIGPIGGFVWAMGLFSSGQSASIAGALTGQYLTEGFLQLKISKSTRILVTRIISLVPCLLIVQLTNLEKANVFLNIVQFVQLPFILIPAIRFICSKRLVDDQVLKGQKLISILGISCLLIGTNIYSLLTTPPESVVIASIYYVLIALYIYFLFYIGTIPLKQFNMTSSSSSQTTITRLS